MRHLATTISVLLLAAASHPAAGQHRLMVSSSADFSTKDHLFVDGETIFIKARAGARLDLSAVIESSFRVEPVRDGTTHEGTLTLQDDGSFAGSVDVSDLEGSSTAWHLSVQVEDAFGHEVRARTAIAIRGRAGHGSADDDEESERDEERAEVVIRGEILAVSDAGSVMIGSTTFLVTDDTRISGEHGAELTTDDLEVGMFARAHLLVNADGSLTAVRIKVERRFERRDVEVTGRIEAVSSTSITVHGLTFAVTEDTEISGHREDNLSIADLSVGMIANVEGGYDDAGVLVASEIRVRSRVHHEGRVRGTVTALSEGFVEVDHVAFTVTDETIISGGGLSVGARVKVHFRILADGSRAALRIRVHSHSDDESELSGD